MIHRPTRPKPRKQPEALRIRDPFHRAVLQRLDALAEALDRNTAVIGQLHDRIVLFVQRPAVPIERARGNGCLQSSHRGEAGGGGTTT